MNVFLMYRDRDFDPKEELPPNAADVTKDLELEMLFGAMAAGDTFLLEVVKTAVLTSLHEPEAIVYRQHMLADCLEQPDVVRQMYGIAVETIERERKLWWWTSRYADSLLHRSVDVLKMFVDVLKRLRQTADEHGSKFRSRGFSRFFGMLRRELDDQYLSTVDDHLRRLTFRGGILMSAELGKGNKGIHYIIRKPPQVAQSWVDRIQSWMEHLPFRDSSRYIYEIADRDESGFRTLSDLKGRGISHVAIALAHSTDHILSFFNMLRLELGFYVGCLNLHDRLVGKGEPICFPEPLAADTAILSARKLYDVCLTLGIQERVVGNDVTAEGSSLVMITGANRGGKSTFLRSVGVAQLMMQCGIFAPAESFRANVCDGFFTHFKREEDTSMRSGKLDEELSRMSSIIDNVRPNSIILFNESFASTNEREGSEIARQIIRALLEAGIKVFYVTHLFDLAQGFYLGRRDTALFLRAERLLDGRRTFQLVEGEPLPTSYGEDLYRRIFGAVRDVTTAIPPSVHSPT